MPESGITLLVAIAAAAVGAWLGSRIAGRRSDRRVAALARSVDQVRRDQLTETPRLDKEVGSGLVPDDSLVPDESGLATLRQAIDDLVLELDRRQRRLDDTFAELREGLVLLDREGRVQLANAAAVSALGADVEPGARLSEISRQPEVLATVRNLRPDSGWTAGDVYEALDGRLFEPQAGALEDGRVALVLRDVTLEKQTETMRREFVANVSHELKTPLTAIRGYAETLGDGLDDSTLAHFVERILVQCRRLEALLADVMELARLESEDLMRRTERVDVNLRELLDEAIERVREAHPGSQTVIELEAPTIVEYHGYREFLGQLFGNLVDNAVKYSTDGSRVDVQVIDDDASVVVIVEDDGPGIAGEHLPHLFERFYRVDSGRARSSGGTGLGLAIVKHAARAHGGKVEVQSRLGHGTRFEVRLPR